MNILNKTDLFHLLFDAFRQHTDSVYFVGGENPYRFSFKGESVTIFVGNIHSAQRTNPDEYRIQCPGRLPAILDKRKGEGDTVLVLGFFADLCVFGAWDPDRFLARNPGVQQVSVYTRLSCMEDANIKGFSTYTDTNGQNVIMLRPELLGLYVENSTALHQVDATDEELQSIAEVYSNTPLGQPLVRPIEVNRQRIRVTRTAYPRSPGFRQEVLEAYSHRCAMCGIQLDLIDAAHIVPHSHPKGVDTVNNGLALCTLHHRSFDTGLLYIEDDYSIHVNSARVEHLRNMDRADGLEQYTQQLKRKLLLPDNYYLFPELDNLILGNIVRGVGLEG